MRRSFVVVVMLVVAFVAGCGGGDDEVSTDAIGGRDGDDVRFAAEMTPHHEQAVEMSILASTNAGDQRVKDLAGRIERAQQAEIQQLESLLTAWGVTTTQAPLGQGEHGHEGVQTEQEIQRLQAAQGTEFDRRFLEMMIDHHEGAITAAERELRAGSDPDARAIATKIVETQKTEITEMKSILESLP